MLKDKLNTYRPSIDPELSEDGAMLGISLISNVANPAVRIRGVAFNNHSTKEMKFEDSKKLRIAAPVLVPGEIYRNDKDEKYFMKFTEEDIEMLVKDFMSRLATGGKDVFNLEHDKDDMVDSFLLEAILVDNMSKRNMIKTTYGIDVPQGSFFIVQQFKSEKVYNDIVERGATSFSFEGFLGTKLVNEYKFKESKMAKNLKLSKMNKPKKLVGVKRVFMSASKKMKFEEVAEGDEIIVIAEDFEEGSEVVVVEDVTEGGIEDFTGEVEVTIDGEDEVLIIEDGKITEVVSEGEETPEVKEAVEVEMESEKKEDEPKEVKAEDEVVVPEIPAVINSSQSELEELYKILAEIKVELSEIKASNSVIEEAVDVNEVREQKYHDALTSFNKMSKKNKR